MNFIKKYLWIWVIIIFCLFAGSIKNLVKTTNLHNSYLEREMTLEYYLGKVISINQTNHLVLIETYQKTEVDQLDIQNLYVSNYVSDKRLELKYPHDYYDFNEGDIVIFSCFVRDSEKRPMPTFNIRKVYLNVE